MQVEILTPLKKLFEGEATSVKLPGQRGGFEVLENHAPLISSLGNGEVTVDSSEGTNTYKVEGGFVEVVNNKVVVLIEGLVKDEE